MSTAEAAALLNSALDSDNLSLVKAAIREALRLLEAPPSAVGGQAVGAASRAAATAGAASPTVCRAGCGCRAEDCTLPHPTSGLAAARTVGRFRWCATHGRWHGSAGGDLCFTTRLLGGGEWKLCLGPDGSTPLTAVVLSGHVEAAAAMLAAGADAGAADAHGRAPLYYAAEADLAGLCEELILRGANVDATTRGGLTALMIAADRGSHSALRMLLARGAAVNVADADGDTALTLASFCGHANVVATLLAAGANKRRVKKNGSTAETLAGCKPGTPPAAREEILALLHAAP